tara:strand:- start:235 stop:1311 length:1077 start_codon:yes stop_codon:yes gene_type:complete
MHYYIISGELSGDIYGARLIKALKKIDANYKFTCWGGGGMKKAGGDLIVDLDSLAFMGFWEVIKNSRVILKNLIFAKGHIQKTQPDAIILIDYPGFNIKIAQYAQKIGIPVFWFVAPQVWAWNKNRIKVMRRCIDKLFVILPFELSYFKQRGINTFYYGHPMMDVVNIPTIDSKKESIIALMPGSRIQEIKHMLPTMLKAVKSLHGYRCVVICASNIPISVYEQIINGDSVTLEYDKSILKSVTAALVTSGTATLELAILKIPQIVCYKLSLVSYILARFFSSIKYISLVNILADKPVVKELIQHNFNVDNIKKELGIILQEKSNKKMMREYTNIVDKIGPKGCFENIACVIYSDLID